MLLNNLLAFGERVSGQPEISLFLALDAEKKDAAEIQARLKREKAVKRQRFVPREETLKRIKGNEGLADVLDSLPKNPFPDTFIVEPAIVAPDALEQLRSEMARWPKVELAQLDSAWVKRVDAMLRIGQAAVLIVGGLLGLALVVGTFNTIRLQILSQRDEIDVSRLLGATDGYIRRPFFYFGALQGLLGGCVAWLIVLGAAELMRQPLTELAGLYNLAFTVRALPLNDSLLLLGFAAGLGWLGAWLSMARHLREG